MVSTIGWLVMAVVLGWVVGLLMTTPSLRGTRLTLVASGLGVLLLSIVWFLSPDLTTLLIAGVAAVVALVITYRVRLRPSVVVAPAVPLARQGATMRRNDDGRLSTPEVPPSRAKVAGGDGLQPLIYPDYGAVVTAHFPDNESSTRARQRLAALTSSPALVMQWFSPQAQVQNKNVRVPEAPRTDTSLLIHLTDATRGNELIRLCKEAGSTLTTFYPARSVVMSYAAPSAVVL